MIDLTSRHHRQTTATINIEACHKTESGWMSACMPLLDGLFTIFLNYPTFPEAIKRVVVYHTRSLHMRITYGRTQKF